MEIGGNNTHSIHIGEPWEKDNGWLASTVNTQNRSKYEMDLIAKSISCVPALIMSYKEMAEALAWYMENTKPDGQDYTTFFNLGANAIDTHEQILHNAIGL